MLEEENGVDARVLLGRPTPEAVFLSGATLIDLLVRRRPTSR